MGSFESAIFGKPCLLGFDEVVAHGNDIVDGQLGGGVRIEHCRVVDVLSLFGCRSLDGEKLDVDVGHVHRSKLGRESSLGCRLNAVGIDHAGNLNAGLTGQIVDKAVIKHVAVDSERLIGNDSLHYV